MKVITFLFGILLVLSPKAFLAQEAFQAGLSQISVTPEVPIRMSGYGNRNDPFSGVHDSIYATAMVFKQGNDQIALISVDVVGFSHEFVDDIKTRLEKATGIKSEQILVIATHNHGGPVTSVYTREPSETEVNYFEKLKVNLVSAVEEAISNMQPAKIGSGKGACMMNINRRARHAEGGIWLGRNPAGICDHEIGLIRIDDLQNQPIGAFINWPCHGTVSGQENTQITGDWPGAAARHFSLHANTLGMVTAGASADINPIYGPNAKFNDIEVIGQLVGEEAAKVFKNIKTFVPNEIISIDSIITAKGKKRSESRMPGLELVEGQNQLIRLSIVKIGSVILAGISGELMTEIGMQIKAKSPFKDTFIVTHCNGSNGYLCTDKAYEEGGYEPMVSKTMPGTAQEILSNFEILINKL